MARKKVNLQWITNDSTRRSTFKKRTNALMKKASELTTLCRVKVSVVAYRDDEAIPEVYPSFPEARQLLSSFEAMPDELENLKKVLNQEEYLRIRISKLKDQKAKSDREKCVDETSHLLHMAMAGHGPGLPYLTSDKLANLKWMVENRLRSAKARFEQIVGQGPILEPLVPSQEQPMLSSQLQTPYTDTKMQNLDSAEECQPQKYDWLTDLSWDGGELGTMVNSDVGTANDGDGPSSSGGDIMQNCNVQGLEIPFSWDPFLDME